MWIRRILPLVMMLAVVGCTKDSSKNTHGGAGHDMANRAMPTGGHMPSMTGEPGLPIKPGESRALGDAPAADANALTVDQMLQRCVGTGQPCVVSSQIGASCTHSGCWFTMPTDNTQALVLVEVIDDAFHLPINAAGTHAIARGTLSKVSFTKAQTYYFQKLTAKVLGQPAPDKTKAPDHAYVFMIDGVRVSRAKDDADAPHDAMDMDHMHMDHMHMDHEHMDHEHMKMDHGHAHDNEPG